jgi:hypothetical protein
MNRLLTVALRRSRDERGASLLLALGFLALCGVLIPAIVNLGGTNLLDTSRLHTQRGTVYAADGAVDATIQYLRGHLGCGTPFGACLLPAAATPPDRTYTVNDVNGNGATVNVHALGAFDDSDRTVELQATVNGGTKVVVDATVVIRDSSTTSALGSQPVDVKSWTYKR